MTSSHAVILLAAGESSRLGRPKQLLDFDGEPLICRVVHQLLALDVGPVGVVVGAHRDPVVAAIANLPAAIIDNQDWSRGMGTSIAAGVRWASEQPAVDGVMILLCDQPAIDSVHLRALIDRSRAATIVATEYGGVRGVPAVFGRHVFERLIALPPDRGAKLLLNDPALDVDLIACEAARIDLDTEQDVERWRKR